MVRCLEGALSAEGYVR